ncbi:MAG: GDP-L-fucose synthase [Methanomassiliicoccales archaeon]|nr:GDP-L-fucose synthase [Methanomassiliicoccales archaeon]
MNDLTKKLILVTGAHGFLGSFVVDNLVDKGVPRANIRTPSSKELDLRQWDNCKRAIKDIDMVLHVAGRGGGISYNRRFPGSLFYDNIIMNSQLMEAARMEGVGKFVGIGTVCSYPKFAQIPFKEEDVWNGYPEETNASYGLSKKMMIVQSEAYRQQYSFNAVNLLMVNLYGPRDDFDLENSHVIPALVRKFVEAVESGAKEVTVWGTGKASREFLYVEDAAEAIVLAGMKYDSSDPVNIGNGQELLIKDLVNKIAELTGFDGTIVWNSNQPDGQPKRCLDVTKAKERFGFEAKIGLDEGLKRTIKWFESSRS